jgi:hypothetical protein
VLFYLDVTGAGGRSLDKKYLCEKPPLKKWLKMFYPVKQPPPKDFKLWRQILPQLRGGVRLHLGKYKSKGINSGIGATIQRNVTLSLDRHQHRQPVQTVNIKGARHKSKCMGSNPD